MTNTQEARSQEKISIDEILETMACPVKTRIPPIEPGTEDAEIAELYNESRELYGIVPKFIQVLSHSPGSARSFLTFDRDIKVAALRAEGIPVGTGYVRPMYSNPTFLKKIAFGKKGCPWTCNKSNISYAEGMCPISENLLDNEFLWFYHIAYSSYKKDMDDIFKAINKIYKNLDSLKSVKIKNLSKLAYKGQDKLKLGKKH